MGSRLEFNFSRQQCRKEMYEHGCHNPLSCINTMPWADNPNVTAIIAAHLPGEQTGNSIADILWGDYNPAGKLPYTIPRNESDYEFPIVNFTSVSTPTSWQADFTEG